MAKQAAGPDGISPSAAEKPVIVSSHFSRELVGPAGFFLFFLKFSFEKCFFSNML